MRTSLIVLGGLVLAAPVAAQSSVTLFGVVDAAISYGSGSSANRTQMSTSGNTQSRIGVRGTEDLGGGLKAGFWLEGGIANDSGVGLPSNTNNQASGSAGGGGLTFNRRSFVSLAGGWGEVRLGRDYTPQFWNLVIFDAFGVTGAGASQSFVGTNGMSVAGGFPAGARASNSISYLTPSVGGFHGQATAYLGENPSGTAVEDDGSGYGLRGGYTAGKFNVAVATSKTQYAAGDISQSNAGLSYDFGVAKLDAQLSRDKLGALEGEGYLLGVRVPLGVGLLRATLSQYQTDAAGDPRTRKLALGYVHALSKRTALYATAAHVSNAGTANQALNGATTGVGDSSKGFDVGVTHSF